MIRAAVRISRDSIAAEKDDVVGGGQSSLPEDAWASIKQREVTPH